MTDTYELPPLPPIPYLPNSKEAEERILGEWAREYARLAIQQERERCANVIEALRSSGENSDKWTVTRDMAFRECAAAIRQGDKP